MSRRREPGRSELHLGEGNGGVFAFPVYPDYSLYQNRKGGSDDIWLECCIIEEKTCLKFIRVVGGELYLIITVDAVKTIEIGLVAVLVPPASHVGLGTVDPQRIRVLVPG